MRTDSLKQVSRLLKYLLFAGAIFYVIIFIFIACRRIRYPFELEWLEGGALEQVRRILSGYPLYGQPSIGFVPFIYTPLYFYFSAGVSKVIGSGFVPLRLLSFAASLGCFGIIFCMVRQETADIFSATLASCLFAATFKIGGAWFDIARVDSLFLLLLLAALYLVKFGSSRKSSVFAGALMGLSFLTKQTALIISLPLMLYLILVNRRRSIFFIGAIALIIGVSTLVLNYLHGGWYSYYIFHLPRQHGIIKSALFSFWSYDIMPLSIAVIISLFYLFAQMLDADRKNFLFFLLSASGMIGGAWLSRLHSGAYNNVLLPAYAMLAILFGVAIHTIFEFIRTAPADKQVIMEMYVYLVCIFQFVCLIYNPFEQIPTRNDLAEGMKFTSKIAQMEGEIFIPYHPYLAVLANKSGYAHAMAMADVVRGDQGTAKAGLVRELKEALREKRFGSIFLDSKNEWFQKDIERYYQAAQCSGFSSDHTLFRPVTGGKLKPEFMYIPRDR